MKNNKHLKSEIISFRLAPDEFLPFSEKLKLSGMSRSAFFRQIFIDGNVSFTVNAIPDMNYRKLLFYYNKSSNNLNQMAHITNSANLNGQVSEITMRKVLVELITIRNILLAGVSNNADTLSGA